MKIMKKMKTMMISFDDTHGSLHINLEENRAQAFQNFLSCFLSFLTNYVLPHLW